jgi:hypothetical protein
MPDAQGKIRYAVVAGGWISQGAFMPGVDQTRNSVMTALVTGDPIKADQLAALYDLKSYSYEQFPELLAKSTRSTWPRPIFAIASSPSRPWKPVSMSCWRSPWRPARKIAWRSMPPPNEATPS